MQEHIAYLVRGYTPVQVQLAHLWWRPKRDREHMHTPVLQQRNKELRQFVQTDNHSQRLHHLPTMQMDTQEEWPSTSTSSISITKTISIYAPTLPVWLPNNRQPIEHNSIAIWEAQRSADETAAATAAAELGREREEAEWYDTATLYHSIHRCRTYVWIHSYNQNNDGQEVWASAGLKCHPEAWEHGILRRASIDKPELWYRFWSTSDLVEC